MKVKIGPYKHNDKRKVKIHIDKYDSWNADNTLAMIIVPVLKQLRQTTHGRPFEFDTHEAWERALDKMIWAFEQVQKESWLLDFNDSKAAYNEHQNQIQKGLDLFSKYYRNLWD